MADSRGLAAQDDAKALNDAAPLVLPIIKNIVDGAHIQAGG